MVRGFEIRVLDDVNMRLFVTSGCESFYRGPLHWICGWGLSIGDIPGSEHWWWEIWWGDVLGRLWMVFFFGGRGRGRGNSRARSTWQNDLFFHWTTRVSKQRFYVIYYILSSGGFTTVWVRPSRTVSPILDDLGRHVWFSSFDNSTTSSCHFHKLKSVKGLLHLVPSRTPRNNGYGVLCTYGLCHMLILLYV
jgi:hypothetical protein